MNMSQRTEFKRAVLHVCPEKLLLAHEGFKLTPLEGLRASILGSTDLTGLSISALQRALVRYPSLASQLRHRLSDIWLARRPGPLLRDTRNHVHELAIADVSAPILRRAIEQSSYGGFVDWAKESFRLHMGSRTAQFRTGAVYTQADSDGTRVAYPDHHEVEKQLHLAFSTVVANQDTPLLAATVSQAIFLNAHPFMDGNGRTARALFNAVFCTGHSRTIQIPLRLFIDHADGGFEIAVRQAELNNDWQDLFCFHSAWLHLCDAVIRDSGKQLTSKNSTVPPAQGEPE